MSSISSETSAAVSVIVRQGEVFAAIDLLLFHIMNVRSHENAQLNEYKSCLKAINQINAGGRKNETIDALSDTLDDIRRREKLSSPAIRKK